MTSLVAGIDFSTKRIDVALIPLEDDHGDRRVPPVRFTGHDFPDFTLAHWRRQGPSAQFRSQHRCHEVAEILPILLNIVDPIDDPPAVFVEEPFGGGRGGHTTADNPLREIYGAILAVALATPLSPNQWRRELGLPGPAKFTKFDAIRHAADWISAQDWDPFWDQIHDPRPAYPDEHKAEALLVALAGRAQLWKHAPTT